MTTLPTTYTLTINERTDLGIVCRRMITGFVTQAQAEYAGLRLVGQITAPNFFYETRISEVVDGAYPFSEETAETLKVRQMAGKFEEFVTERNLFNNGFQVVVRFPNGACASIIDHDGSYGLELMRLNSDGSYRPGENPTGHLSPQELDGILTEMMNAKTYAEAAHAEKEWLQDEDELDAEAEAIWLEELEAEQALNRDDWRDAFRPENGPLFIA